MKPMKYVWQSPSPLSGALRSHILIDNEWKPGNTLCNSQGIDFSPTGFLGLELYPECKNCLRIEEEKGIKAGVFGENTRFYVGNTLVTPENFEKLKGV